jgi:hypothetical protein
VGIPLGAPTTRRLPVGAPKNVIDVYWGPQEGGSDTMLNTLCKAEEEEREEREPKPIIDYIVLYCDIKYIRMNTIASLYRREKKALTPNLTNVGQTPHIH